MSKGQPLPLGHGREHLCPYRDLAGAKRHPAPGAYDAAIHHDDGAQHATAGVQTPGVLGVEDQSPVPVGKHVLVERWQEVRTGRLDRRGILVRPPIRLAFDVVRRQRGLDGIHPEPDRDSMNRAANAAANRIVDEYKAKDQAFDLATRHGATQGAHFP